MKFGVIIFPGSNCDHDAYWTIQHVAKQPVTFLWHESHDLQNCDAIIVPGGFAFGDYLRTGAIAKFSPVMESVRKFADGGGLVLGICNGFQILCESGLLPGALMRNVGLKYVCKPVQVRVENVETPFTNACSKGEVLTIPIGHMEGNYFCDPATLQELQARESHRVSLLLASRRNHRSVQSKRIVGEHRRNLQPGRKRRRHDAAPGTRGRAGIGRHRRSEGVSVDGRRHGQPIRATTSPRCSVEPSSFRALF